MKYRDILYPVISVALIGGAPGGAMANDAVSGLAGFIAGAVVGNAISNANNANHPRRVYVQERTVVHRAPAVSGYQREQNRQVQTALNYFGFPAGVADGVMGQNSRNAIAQYQAFMGVPPSGALTDYDRAFLTSSYDRAIVGGPATSQIIAANGQGPRGLLIAYRQEQYGVPQTPVVPQLPVVAPPPVIVAPVPVVAAPTTAPEPAAPVVEVSTRPAALPNFVTGGASNSMASECNRVNIATSSHGGYITVADMTNPNQAIDEQFCLARTYAIDQGDSLAGTVQGFSMAEIEEQCAAFAPTMREYQARLASQSPAEAGAAFRDFVVGTGLQPAQLSANARICLGIGYKTDNSDLAVASAMVLVGLGEQAYGELLAYHLMNGFGVPRRPDLGVAWLSQAVDALGGGATPLVATGGSDRVALLRQALVSLNGPKPGQAVVQDAAAKTGGFVMPTAKPASN